MDYNPDNWVVLKIKEAKDPFYKVLVGWSGGYLDGDSWRMNSGVTEVKEEGDYYEFYGESGSCYRCHKESYGLRMNNAGVYNQLRKQFKDQLQLMPDDTEWVELTKEKKNENQG